MSASRRSPVLSLSISVAGVLVLLPGMVPAQAPGQSQAVALPVPVEQLAVTDTSGRAAPSARAPRAALPAALAGITTDTGALRPGHQDFATYTTPGLCAAAGRAEARAVARSLAAQTAAAVARWGPATPDTLPTAVVALIRRCGQRFTPETTAPGDLRDLLELRLLQMDDAGARAAAARWLASATTPAERLTVLRETMQLYLAATPARVGAADSVVLQVRVVAPDDALAQVNFGGGLLWYAERTLDRALLRRVAERMIADQTRLPDSVAARADGLLTPYQRLLTLALLDDDTAAVTRVVAQTRTGLTRSQMHPNGLPTPLGPTLQAVSRDSVVALLLGSATAGWAAYTTGRVTPPLRPARWRFAEAADTLPPARPAVLVNIPYTCYAAYSPDISEVWDILPKLGACSEIFDYVKRLRARYPASQLAITLHASLAGYSLVRGRGTLRADEEAEWLWWFLHDNAQLAGALALDVTPVTTLPAPDGRRVPSWPEPPSLVLTARDGRTLYEYRGDRANPRVFDALVAQAVAGRQGRGAAAGSGGCPITGRSSAGDWPITPVTPVTLVSPCPLADLEDATP